MRCARERSTSAPATISKSPSTPLKCGYACATCWRCVAPNSLRRHNEQLDEIVHDRTRELQQARLETLERLALAAEFRDDDTHEHAQRVGRTAALLAEKIGWRPHDIERLRRAGPLHDIGKIGIPDAVLLKPGRLTHEEFELIKRHTIVGAQILSGSDSDIL